MEKDPKQEEGWEDAIQQTTLKKTMKRTEGSAGVRDKEHEEPVMDRAGVSVVVPAGA